VRPVVFGNNPQNVLELIKDRARRNSREDSRKLGLVIEGGSMRAVIAAGSLFGLYKLGFTDVFDEVYACSAGALNAAYFLSGQSLTAMKIYYEDVNNWSFINPFRLWKIVDIDYLFDTIFAKVKPLDTKKILDSPTRLFISLLAVSTGDGLLMVAQERAAPLLDILKAATAMPLLYNRTVHINGAEYADGAWVNSLPLDAAMDSGCTDILVLSTCAPNYIEPEPPFWERMLFRLLFTRGRHHLEEMLFTAHDRGNSSRRIALGHYSPGPLSNIATICPPNGDVGYITKKSDVLKGAARRTATQIVQIFDGDSRTLQEITEYFQ